MATYIERGNSLFIPFRNGVSISDSQCRPRMYKSKENFEKSFPTHNLGNKDIELVEYKEVKHGAWINGRYNDWKDNAYEEMCSVCGRYSQEYGRGFCPNCGAKLDR